MHAPALGYANGYFQLGKMGNIRWWGGCLTPYLIPVLAIPSNIRFRPLGARDGIVPSTCPHLYRVVCQASSVSFLLQNPCLNLQRIMTCK